MAEDERTGEVLDLQQRILQGIVDLKEDLGHLKQRMTTLDGSTVSARRGILALHEVVVQICPRLDTMDDRIARIECRRDPVQPAKD
jgi:hypothetical protein